MRLQMKPEFRDLGMLETMHKERLVDFFNLIISLASEEALMAKWLLRAAVSIKENANTFLTVSRSWIS